MLEDGYETGIKAAIDNDNEQEFQAIISKNPEKIDDSIDEVQSCD
jgi:hypothetical protein